MKKLYLGVMMILTGLIGLSATVCGMFLLLDNGIGLIGVIPGLLLLWATWAIWKAYKAADVP